eukprot:469870-Pelagomonas_calceolata.AAC.1
MDLKCARCFKARCVRFKGGCHHSLANWDLSFMHAASFDLYGLSFPCPFPLVQAAHVRSCNAMPGFKTFQQKRAGQSGPVG